MINAFLEYRFLQNALLAGVMASVLCGIIGVIIVEKKLVMMSGGIAHTAYGGVGLGYLLGFEPIIGAFIFSILAALGIGFIKRKGAKRQDVVIGLFWSLGMALGILFIAFMPGYPPELSSYLFGNILFVLKSDIYLMMLLTVISSLIVIVFFNHWKSFLFDEEFTHIVGVKTAILDYALLILAAMTIVVLIRVVGIILSIALLTAPAATSALLVNTLKRRMLCSIALGIGFTLSGLVLSHMLNISSGAVIVILSVTCYFCVYFIRSILLKRNLGKAK